jgi:hypothetical protein
MVIAIALAERLHVRFTISDLLYTLYHDADESRTGDIPAPAKDHIYKTLGAGDQEVRFCPWLDYEIPGGTWVTVSTLADLIEALTYISRWGVGDHAARVAQGVREKIDRACPIGWEGAVNQVIGEIDSDFGR